MAAPPAAAAAVAAAIGPLGAAPLQHWRSRGASAMLPARAPVEVRRTAPTSASWKAGVLAGCGRGRGPSRLGVSRVGKAAAAEAPLESRRFDSATCLLVLLNAIVFLYEHVAAFGGQPLSSWWLQHDPRRFKLYQLVTATLCHRDYPHLASNLFGLYIFGRAVEEQSGFLGVIIAYVLCGAFANAASAFCQRGHFASLGASGAVFGLFIAAALVKVRRDPRSLVECYVLGQFALSQVWGELTGPARPGVDSTAHLAGAVGGLLAFVLLRRRRPR